MSLRPPSQYAGSALSGGGAVSGSFATLDHEIAAEQASSLGRAGERVEKALASLRGVEADAAERTMFLKAAAEAVYAYFIQRELCGVRRHHDAIQAYDIPGEVLARLGAS